MLNRLVNLFRPKLSREAFEAYFYRLPERVQVEWKRDGRMIIGWVNDGNNQFVTQGKNVDDFIEMVNDAVYAVHGIPFEYARHLRSIRSFEPNQQEKQKLMNVSVTGAALGFVRNEQALHLA